MATTSLLLPELLFLSPQSTLKRRVSLSKPSSLSRNLRYGCVSVRTRRIRALKEEGRAVVEVDERESKLIKELNGNNGAAATTRYEERRYSNGAAVVESENGSLVKYVNGNGVAAPSAAEVVEDSAAKEDGRKRRLEEIGKEDAWFKQAGKEVEVSVTPGGRWSRFKTYSTIQRTLEIWGFVLAFIFKAWLNNQKFSYRGVLVKK